MQNALLVTQLLAADAMTARPAGEREELAQIIYEGAIAPAPPHTPWGTLHRIGRERWINMADAVLSHLEAKASLTLTTLVARAEQAERALAARESDSVEWWCDRENTVHPTYRPGKFTQYCPDCGDLLEPSSANLRELKHLRTDLAAARAALKLVHQECVVDRSEEDKHMLAVRLMRLIDTALAPRS